MKTRYFFVSRKKQGQNPYIYAARILRRGGLVAFPTETVYGLGADARDHDAVMKIFKVKGRPDDNPLIVHVAGIEDIPPLVSGIPAVAEELMRKFVPGPLTMVMPKSDLVPLSVTAGLDTVAIRIPGHPIAQQLLRAAGLPVAAPSANLSGKPSPTTGKHVLRDLAGRIEVVLDGGPCSVGLESTILDVTQTPPVMLRPGAVGLEELRASIGEVQLDAALGLQLGMEGAQPRSPGMKYIHYSPDADVYLLEGELEAIARGLPKLVKHWQGRGANVGLLLSSQLESLVHWTDNPFYLEVLGDRHNPSAAARRMFAAFRNCDRAGVDLVFVESYEPEGIGLALMNRLQKASGRKTIKFA